METDTYLKLTDHQGETVHLLLSHLGGGKHALSTSVGSGTSTVSPPGGGGPVNLDEQPLVVTLNDGTERIIPTDGLRGRQLVITAVGDAAITVTQQVVKDGPFLFAHVVTASSSDDDRTTTVGTTHGGNVYAIKLQRTAGTNATSTGRLG